MLNHVSALVVVALLLLVHGVVVRAGDVPELSVIAPITEQYSRHSYITAIELSPGGRILLVWGRYTGDGKDHAPNKFVMAHSDDAGRSWSEPVELPCGSPRMNLGGCSLLDAPDGKVQLYYWFRNGGNDSALMVIESGDRGVTWNSPRAITPKSSTSFTACSDRVIRMKSGRLIWPFHTLTGKPHADKDLGVLVGRSDDQGQAWSFAPELSLYEEPGIRGYTYAKTLDHVSDEQASRLPLKLHEPTAVECSDGSLLMLTRSTRGKFFESRSTDGGATWSTLKPSNIPAQTAPPYLRRLNDGRLLLVWNPPTAEEVRKNYFPTTKRPRLQLAVSSDDGRTWSEPRVVADDGGRNGFCYPAVLELTTKNELLIFITRSPEIIYPADLVMVRLAVKELPAASAGR